MKTLLRFLFSGAVLLCLGIRFCTAGEARPRKPNVIFILTDDMGRGDIASIGGQQGATPNLDRLGREGMHFTQFYVASPICSASRTAFTTGMYPGRWRINSYLHNRAGNRKNDQADWLDPKAPSVARAFQGAGYATAHFGKWHMGGGRDVQDAPLPSAYGFDESHVNCEGMGPRFENFGNSRKQTLNTADGSRLFRHQFTQYWVDRSIDFVRRHRDRPFYLELWPQDVHTPHDPSEEAMERTKSSGLPEPEHRFRAVLNEYDRQIGRFLDTLRELALEENTILVFAADNGPEPSFNHARTLGQRGMKWSLYEGGIREPFFARWPGHIPASQIDNTTVVSSVDYLPTICALAGVQTPKELTLDGIDQSAAWQGAGRGPARPLFWEYGRNHDYFYPHNAEDKSPNLAIRDGDWKLLINADGTAQQLYNLKSDPAESKDVAAEHPSLVKSMTSRVQEWRKALP